MSQTTIQCPHCGASLPGSAILCVRCGFNLKTHQRVGSAPIPQKSRYQVENSGSGKKVGVIVLFAILLAGSIAAVLFFGKNRTPKSTLGDDPYVEEQLGDGATNDLDKWLAASPNRMVLGMSHTQAQGLADSWKQRGAKRVIGFGAGVTLSLGVELPDKPEQRKYFFEWANEHRDWSKPPVKDIGQKWLLMHMHL